MNDLKEIGGFIVSADPFVQHDTSLSGNGTVNSPLGVVPGYNETVLWSGNTQLSAMNTSASAIHLSESLYNFDKIGVYAKPLSTHNEYKVSEFTPNSAEEGFDFVNWYKGGGLTTGGAVRFGIAFIQYNATGMWVKSNELFQLSVDKNGVSTQNNQSIMKKIVGINRKQ